MTQEELDEMFARLWKLDDKPHLIFSFMRELILKYGTTFNSVHKRELLEMADLGYENAHKLLK